MSENKGYIPTPIAEEHYPCAAHEKNIVEVQVDHEKNIVEVQVESTREPVMRPTIEPIPWASLDPKLAAGLVKAQSVAVTVVNDGLVAFREQKYRYPTQSAIACAARNALKEGGLAIIVQGFDVSVHDNQRYVESNFVILHESGACTPVMSAKMPVITDRKGMDKAIAGAISHMRKYISACILNMGWADEADVEQRDDGISPETKKPAIESRLKAPEKPNTPLDGLRIQARDGCKSISGLLSISTHESHKFATGLDTGLSKSTTPAELSAIANCASIMNDLAIENKGSLPKTHSEFINAISQMDVTLEFVNGEITDLGRQIDEKFSA